LVKSKVFIPDCGDIVWLTFNPQSGHDQTGRRPALVISPSVYNDKTGLAIFCPITSQKKDYPFEVIISGLPQIEGVILSDQIKSLDWKARNAEFICKLQKKSFDETVNKISTLLGIK